MHHQVPHNNGITPVMQAPIPLTQGINVDVSPLTQIGWNTFWRIIYIFMLLHYSWNIHIMRVCIDGRNWLETGYFPVKWAKLLGLYLPCVQLILLPRPLGCQVVSNVLPGVSGGFQGVSRRFMGILSCDIITGYHSLIQATHPRFHEFSILNFLNYRTKVDPRFHEFSILNILNYRTKVVRLWLLQVDHHIFLWLAKLPCTRQRGNQMVHNFEF